MSGFNPLAAINTFGICIAGAIAYMLREMKKVPHVWFLNTKGPPRDQRVTGDVYILFLVPTTSKSPTPHRFFPEGNLVVHFRYCSSCFAPPFLFVSRFLGGTEPIWLLSPTTCMVLWQENISFMAFFRAVSKMMKISKIDDFSLTDISEPKRPRWAMPATMCGDSIPQKRLEILSASFFAVSHGVLVLPTFKVHTGLYWRSFGFGVWPLKIESIIFQKRLKILFPAVLTVSQGVLGLR